MCLYSWIQIPLELIPGWTVVRTELSVCLSGCWLCSHQGDILHQGAEQLKLEDDLRLAGFRYESGLCVFLEFSLSNIGAFSANVALLHLHLWPFYWSLDSFWIHIFLQTSQSWRTPFLNLKMEKNLIAHFREKFHDSLWLCVYSHTSFGSCWVTSSLFSVQGCFLVIIVHAKQSQRCLVLECSPPVQYWLRWPRISLAYFQSAGVRLIRPPLHPGPPWKVCVETVFLDALKHSVITVS